MPRLSDFPANHIADMHYFYGWHHGSARAACLAYREQYPERQPQPSARNFQEVHRLLSIHGIGGQRRERARQVIVDISIEEAVLSNLFSNPTTSIRRLAAHHGISKTSVWRILKKEGLHPYHYQRVQHLHGNADFISRCVFSTWIQRQSRMDPQFSQRILWMDESTFTRNGITNARNLHRWSISNPHLKRESTFQVQFSVNVWAGLIGRYLIGPVILPATLRGETFLSLLRDDLPDLLEDVPILALQRMYLQMDGCPAHYSLNVRNFLNERYPNKWIGRGGPVAWPPRSPDLTPLDYFFWGAMKQAVYSEPINTQAELIDRINHFAQEIKENEDMVQSATKQIVMRTLMCLQQNGNHFENLMHII